MNTRWIWALRDVLRRPGEALLIAAALATLSAVLGTTLLATQAVTHTARRLVGEGPSLVIRRLDAGGWAPLPAAEAVAAAKGVRGVTDAWPRTWGVVAGPQGAVTLIGTTAAAAQALGLPAPSQAEVIVGPGVVDGPVLGGELALARLDGRPTLPLKVSAVLTRAHGAALHQAALVHPERARKLLGLPEGHASDLAVAVHHDSEQAAILPDLTAALAFPARAVTRLESAGQYTTALARRGSLATLAALPALLAVGVLLIGVARDRVGRRAEVGLLKAMGWGTADVVGLHLRRALWIAVPATGLGLAAAYAAVLWPGLTWPGALLFGWSGPPPPLSLDGDGAALVLAEVGALVITPWVLAALWPAFRAATADPGLLLGEGDA
ncbi:MAG: FtsX-like permease family protein [Myxococcales bacterium]|nr:FtsX-like permease family protein [Myxococcales bacterium]